MGRGRPAGRWAIQVLVVALLLEVMLRLAVPGVPGYYRTGLLFNRHPTLGWYHIPGAAAWWKTPEFTAYSEINSLGLRDVERSYAKEPGVYRVLILGDSFVDAMQVSLEQVFPRVLERLLAEQAPDRRIEVINAGVSAYSTDQEFLFFQEEGRKFDPDLVVLTFFENDVGGNSRRLARGGPLLPKPYFDLDGPDSLRFISLPARPAVVDAAGTLVRSVRGRSVLATVVETGVIDPLVGRLARHPQGMPEDLLIYSKTVMPEWEEAWLITELLIERLKGSVEASGAGFVLVQATSWPQVYPDIWWEKTAAQFALQPADFDLELPNRRIREMAERRGWQVLDLLPTLRREAAGGPPLHFAGDGHWTAEGHRLAAREIARYLTGQYRGVSAADGPRRN